MREMTARLGSDPDLGGAYAAAHRDYLHRRAAIEAPCTGFPSG